MPPSRPSSARRRDRARRGPCDACAASRPSPGASDSWPRPQGTCSANGRGWTSSGADRHGDDRPPAAASLLHARLTRPASPPDGARIRTRSHRAPPASRRIPGSPHTKPSLHRKIAEARLRVPVQDPRSLDHLDHVTVDHLVAQRADLTAGLVIAIGRCRRDAQDAARFVDVFADESEMVLGNGFGDEQRDQGGSGQIEMSPDPFERTTRRCIVRDEVERRAGEEDRSVRPGEIHLLDRYVLNRHVDDDARVEVGRFQFAHVPILAVVRSGRLQGRRI